MKHLVHGELNFYLTNGKIPKKAKKINPVDGKYIVADSETTGNHHCVAVADDLELFELDDTLYMSNKKDAEIFCVDTKRHDTIHAEPGVWEIRPSQEYDYLTEEIRAVRD